MTKKNCRKANPAADKDSAVDNRKSQLPRCNGKRLAPFTAALMAATQLAGCAAPHVRSEQPAHHETRPVAVTRAPNVLVILADDLGYPDVSAYGATQHPTPNIDRIGAAGVTFTDGYVAASVCAVSRAGLLTGRQPASFGFTYNITETSPADEEAGIPVNVETLASRLSEQGYHTGAFGKWHLGSQDRYYPTNRGFDEFFGFLAGESIYADPATPGLVTTPTADERKKIELRTGDHRLFEGAARQVVAMPNRYLTFEITDRTLDFIDRSAAQDVPFFGYVAYNAPHWPMQVPQDYYDRFSDIKDPVRRTYVAMIAALDDSIGRILDRLEQRGLAENTMVFFLSDNGCPDFLGFCDLSHPFGAGKFTYLEGGTRVPFMLSWPAGLAQRGRISTPVSSLDIVPTVLAATPRNEGAVETDGVDLLPLIARPAASDRYLYWSQPPVSAVRHGRYKLWRSEDWNETRLFDLSADPWELTDVSAQHPDVLADLRARLLAHDAALPAPLWPLHGKRRVTISGRETEWVH